MNNNETGSAHPAGRLPLSWKVTRMTNGPAQGRERDIFDPEVLGFDPAELRRKYAHERAIRLRPDGNDQFVEVADAYARFEEDPRAEAAPPRAPIEVETDAVILGGGIGGLLAAVRLQEIGVTDIRIVEHAGDFGGVWYWNRYPGAQCDTESFIYLPLLEETGYIPTERYVHQPEILAHLQRIGRQYNLYERALFHTKLDEARWSEPEQRWIIRTDRGDVLKARFYIMSTGPLHRPKLPGVRGIQDFKGPSFHTSRWDYSYTGGDTTGGLHGLADKRVGLVGTGATGIQVFPALARYAKHLYLFQRTPASVDERNNRPTDPAWVKAQRSGWQYERDENFCMIMGGQPVKEDLVNDKWTDFFRLAFKVLDVDGESATDERKALAREIADYTKGNEIRERVARIVKDPVTAEKLKPWYGQWCKRPSFHDEYLPAFNRPNVTLVATSGEGIERITENAVVVDGKAYEVDCLIFATGFETGTAYTRRSECEVYGRNSIKMSEAWSQGMRTFHGFMSHGFPNCFHIGLTQTGVAFNYTYTATGQARHLAYLIGQVIARGAKTMEATAEAEAAWVDLVSSPGPLRKYQETCTPGYYNVEGKNTGHGFIDNQYPLGAVAFFHMLEEWRAQGDLAGVVIS
jgi:cation diffusion facilitator CzcD-associated flavoprotein CzcO